MIDAKGVISLVPVRRREKGEQKIRDSPTMLLKTKVNKNDNLTYPTISMKTNALFFLSHDMYEKKGTWLKPPVENGDGGVHPRPLSLSSLGGSGHLRSVRISPPVGGW